MSYKFTVCILIYSLCNCFFTPLSNATLIETATDKKTSFVQINAFDMQIVNGAIKRTYNAGAGAIIDSAGYIITNLHILYLKPYIQVTLDNGQIYSAKLIGILDGADLALIKIDANTTLTPLELANSDKVRLKDRIIHIGNSHFLDNTISEGKITGIGRKNKSASGAEVFQVNLNLYQGDSGGPLLDEDGRLIGLVTSQLRNQQRKTFAIPSNKIKILYSKYTNTVYNP